MPRVDLPFILSIAVTASGTAALQSASGDAESSRLQPAAAEPKPAPAWSNRSWLNTDRPLTLAGLRGRVVFLNFWVFTCHNCTNTVPSLVDFDRRYRERGLTMIGIHTPEFPPYAGEHDRSNVERALRRYGIDYPNAQDNDRKTWGLYGIRYWPSFVLIDKRGNIRYEGYGEFQVGDENYRLWSRRIEALTGE